MSDTAKKILIVEDERPLSKALELKLTKEGYETTVATDGGSAVELLKKQDFDVAVLDLVMPQYDGFHVLEYVHEKKLKMKVIVLSNLSQTEDVKKAKNFGAEEYFIKSNTPIVTLVDNIKKILSK
jgi:DNA-binding response OmpR family regulator